MAFADVMRVCVCVCVCIFVLMMLFFYYSLDFPNQQVFFTFKVSTLQF
jgi:hypothetical protein